MAKLWLLFFILFSQLLTSQNAGAASALTCKGLFPADKLLIQMAAKYRGEDKGIVLKGDSVYGKRFLKVKYFSSRERDNSQLMVTDGRLLPVTSKARKLFNERDRDDYNAELIFVIDKNFNFYAADGLTITSERAPRIHHSSIVSGENVFFAGTIKLNKAGYITQITNDSGHYLTSYERLVEVIHYLYLAGVDLRYADLSGDIVIDKYRNFSLTFTEWSKLPEFRGLFN